MMLCLCASLMLIIGLFRLWPPPSDEPNSDIVFDSRGDEIVHLQTIEPTRQEPPRRPPPPLPQPPIPVPDDVILPEELIEFESEMIAEEAFGVGAQISAQGVPGFVARPHVTPRPIRFVEPEYSSEARRQRIRAQIEVEVKVSAEGRVVESRIVERFLLGSRGEAPTPVQSVGYGLDEAAVSAAERWIFRPATHEGVPVATYTTLTFSFGV